MKFVHAADLHLDSPMRGLDRYDGAPRDLMRGATRRALENLVALCRDEDARLLLIAGDLYDGNWKDYGTGLFFANQMSRLREVGVRVVLLRGNHDAASQITKSLPLPENVRELGVRKPETVLFEDLGLAVHGQGFATRAVTDDLAARYPDAVRGLVNIGLLHTSVEGRPGHESYAPTTLATLLGKGYDYWALGHVHAREVLSSDPWVVFPGNLQGRHARETGSKGATVVTVTGGKIASVEHAELDVVRWERLEIDVSGARSDSEIVDRTRTALERATLDAQGRVLAARIVIRGATPAHSVVWRDSERITAEVRALAADVGSGVWVEKVQIETRAALDLPALRGQEGAIGDLARTLDALRTDDEELKSLGRELEDLWRKLPPEAREGEDGLRLDDPAYLRGLLGEVEQTILPPLVEEEAP